MIAGTCRFPYPLAACAVWAVVAARAEERAETPAPASALAVRPASVVDDERAGKLLEGLDEAGKQRVLTAVREFEGRSAEARPQALAALAAQLRQRIEEAVAGGKKVPATILLMGRKNKAEFVKCEKELLVVKLTGESNAGQVQLRWGELDGEGLVDSARACVARDDADGVALLLNAYSPFWGAEAAARARLRTQPAVATAKPNGKQTAAETPGETWLKWAQGVSDGKTYVVDARSGGGGNGTPESPFKTVTEASKRIAAGDTVIIRGGIYSCPKYSLSFAYRGSATGHPDGRPRITTFKAAPGERVILTGLDGRPPYALIGGAPYLRLEGLWFGGPVRELIRGVGENTKTADGRSLSPDEAREYLQGGFCADSNFMQVVGCTFFGFSGTMARGHKMLIQDCRYVNMGGGFHHHPIYLGGASHLIVDLCTFVGGEGYCLHGWHSVHGFIATRNLVLSGGYGFVADGSDHLAANNFFWKMRGSPDGGSRKIGAWLPGDNTTFVNNVLGPDAPILGSDGPKNRIENNVFLGVAKWGNSPVVLKPAELGAVSKLSAEEMDAAIAELEKDFAQPLEKLLKDETLEPLFAKLRKGLSSGTSFAGKGQAWFKSDKPFDLGPNAPVPGSLEEFWEAAGKLGIPDWQGK